MADPLSRRARSSLRTMISAISRSKRVLRESGREATTLLNYMKRRRKRRLSTVARSRLEMPEEKLVFAVNQKTVWFLSHELILISKHSREIQLTLETAQAALLVVQTLNLNLIQKVAWLRTSLP